jgi:hypothetical protein
MTNEELAKIEKRLMQPVCTTMTDREIMKRLIFMQQDCAALLAHLRASQTPPQAVTEDELARTACKAYGYVWSALPEKWVRDMPQPAADKAEWRVVARDILALLAEKPAPTPTPLTEEERYDLETAKRDRVLGYDTSSRIVARLIAIIDRLSASPTAPKGEA